MATPGRRVLREINRASPNGRGGQTAIVDFFAARTPTTNNIVPESFLTPSPDEQIIRLRGRKIIQIDSDSEPEAGSTNSNLSTTPKKTSGQKTPRKSPLKRTPSKTTPTKTTTLPTRTSPRKRLHLPSTSECVVLPLTPTKTPKTKRKCITWTGNKKLSPKSSIKALSNSQLVELLLQLLERRPDLENKDCIEQGRHLVKTEQWLSVVEYSLLAWKHVQNLPDWDNPSHNKPKQMCFKTLASQCLLGLRSNVFSREQYEDILERLLDAQETSELMDACVKYVESCVKKLSK